MENTNNHIEGNNAAETQRQEYEKQQMENLFGSSPVSQGVPSETAAKAPERMLNAPLQTESEQQPSQPVNQNTDADRFAHKARTAGKKEEKSGIMKSVSHTMGGRMPASQMKEQTERGYERAAESTYKRGERMTVNRGEQGQPQTRSRTESRTALKTKSQRKPTIIQKAKKEAKQFVVNSFFDKLLGVQTLGVTTAMKWIKKII